MKVKGGCIHTPDSQELLVSSRSSACGRMEDGDGGETVAKPNKRVFKKLPAPPAICKNMREATVCPFILSFHIEELCHAGQLHLRVTGKTHRTHLKFQHMEHQD